ncbi:T9SS type A sorting domain-containing protein [Aureivirga sp. CE67]|uniref:T9SS type A sorting domain-containing protein n=1 Tax=Aureivirga sp. CE67 TaxID=1788983 RepID=UPI0018CA433E|nr:T9SS type A sorting domain-containing protein [Aureivirga sp. CE67]
MVETAEDTGVVLEDYSNLAIANYFCYESGDTSNLIIEQNPTSGTTVFEDTEITLTVTDSELNLTKEVNFTAKFSKFIGINDEILSKIKLYPNPSNGIINLDGYEEVNAIKVYDFKGAEVCNFVVDQSIIDLQDLNSGIYFLEIELSTGTKHRTKIILE